MNTLKQTSNRYFWKIFMSCLVVIVMLSACGGQSKDAANEAAKQHKDRQGQGVNTADSKDSLVLAIGSEPESGFDPITGWGMYGSPLFQSTLFKRDNDLKIVNDLATSFQVSDDGRKWTVTIRDDVLFSDGEQLQAEDVQFTFEMAKRSGSTIDLTNLTNVEAIGDNEVVFYLEQPQSSFQYVLVTLGIVPKHLYNETYSQQPVGSGPFTFVQWDKGQQLIVAANPYYYGNKPYFQHLTFLFLQADAAFVAAQTGVADMAYIPTSFSEQQVAGMRLEKLNTVDNRGIVFPYTAVQQKNEVTIGNDVTNDLAIRKAINLAVDRQVLVDGVLDGYGTPAYSNVDGLPWGNPETAFADGQVEEAKRLLAEHGWQDSDGDGIVEKEGVAARFTLVYPASDVTRQSLSLAVADMVRAIGIDIVVEGKSWEMMEQHKYTDAMMMGWGSHDPLETYHIYSSSYAGVDFFNTGHYSNEQVDRWMEKALMAASEEAALPYWQKAQWDGSTGLSANGDAPWAWLVNLQHLYLVDEKLAIGQQRIQPHGHGWPVTDNIDQWKWVDN
ncbi:ABC transporter substrate-binding protein [Paenibacillus yanchengensis]|uniref:ABC transporter substrate-binding protein n=1 Tax=Paenibacillus yanchengensis TaxID=2035833 RepID=A0ABW4YH84_9BACL